jgi:CRP-like cAMP-binding protein
VQTALRTETVQTGHAYSRWIARLEAVGDLAEGAREIITRLPIAVKHCPSEFNLARQGDVTTQCCLLVDGFLYRQKHASDGRRKILSFHVPGDIPDLYSMYVGPMDHTLTSAGPVVIGLIPHEVLLRDIASSPDFRRIVLREVLTDAAIAREWLLSIGARQAPARLAHILCEITVRLQAVGLAKDLTFHWPVSQAEMADACGISPVHANRVIQDLRARDLVEWHGRNVAVLDWVGLVNAADFVPGYLHLEKSRTQ